MPRHVHPDDDKVYACPECDGVPVYRRVRNNTEFDTDKEFACYQCNTGFDDPIERPAKTHTGRTNDPEVMPDPDDVELKPDPRKATADANNV